MADPAVSPESSAQGNPAESATQGANAGVDFKMVESLKKQMEAQSAIIRRLSERLEKQEKEKQPEKKVGPISQMNEQIALLKGQMEAERQKAERARIASATQSIRTTLTENGVDTALAKMASEAILNRIKPSLQFQDDGTGADVPVVVDGESATTLSEYMAAYVQSDEGKAMIPTKPAPSLFGVPRNGNSNPLAGKIRVTQQDLREGRVKTSDVLAGKVVVIDA